MPIYVERRSQSPNSEQTLEQKIKLVDATIQQSSKGICEFCKKRASVCIHEIEPKSLVPAIWWLEENRIALCHICHDKVHSTGTRKMAEKLREAIAYRTLF